MKTINPQKKYQRSDTVTISRREYEYLIQLKKIAEFSPTLAQKKSLIRAENNFKKGKTLSYNELVQKLGLAN